MTRKRVIIFFYFFWIFPDALMQISNEVDPVIFPYLAVIRTRSVRVNKADTSLEVCAKNLCCERMGTRSEGERNQCKKGLNMTLIDDCRTISLFSSILHFHFPKRVNVCAILGSLNCPIYANVSLSLSLFTN